jgi:hypothetical protein
MEMAELLTQRLELIHQWYKGMVNPQSGMLEYLYLPHMDSFLRERSPIRDIASVWDIELLERFLHKDELRPVVETSLRHYQAYLIERDGYLILDPRRLEEPSSIAHSSFMILALLYAPLPSERSLIAGLVEGILRQQRPDGSYKVYFHDLPDAGEELYAGEAMLALLETYRHLGDPRCLSSAERAFLYYDAQYFRRGRVAADILVFFANWQSQACRLLFECTQSVARKHEVAGYVFRMHDRIIELGFYDDVERAPARQVSVAVACALEGLNDAYAIARASQDARAERYRRCICIGLTYLLMVQCTRNCTERERGGFGMALDERAQRIDVTGHAASAFMKSVENRIACPPAAG